jgi:hypothetical protein
MTFCSTAMTAGSARVVPTRAPARPWAFESVRRTTRLGFAGMTFGGKLARLAGEVDISLIHDDDGAGKQ